MVFGSWDAEEFGLIGSTEWGEQHAQELVNADAYFNMDVAVSGPKFGASSVPSLKQFLRDISVAIPSPTGGTLHDAWQKSSHAAAETSNPQETSTSTYRPPAAQAKSDVQVGDLGSGSDYTVFLQHLGVPSTDVGSTGAYGVYHSVFDDFNWFKKFGDPDFLYEQEMARVFGLEAIRMADADVLPYDYEEYGKEIVAYVDAAKKKADLEFATQAPDFSAAAEAARKFELAGTKILSRQQKISSDPAKLNQALRQSERALLIADGLPGRPWFRHAIYAPGRYTGYAAVVIPGVNEAIDKRDLEATKRQIALLAAALSRATATLNGYH
jgi:N-acetylated-alpha-linked acidic dipeptidase